jgi:uncharacterized repeat protein (TIGR02543 family)
MRYFGGPVMNASGTSVTVTPIYWGPVGSFPSTYTSLTKRFIHDVALASGSNTNVFSILPQYSHVTNPGGYQITMGTPIMDSNFYPPQSCGVDTGPIYDDGSSYVACLTDAQLQVQLTALGLTSTLQNLYVLLLPEGVEICKATSNGSEGGQCSIDGASNAFCGYHSYVGSASSPTIYDVLPYAVVDSPTGYTCSSSAAQFSDGSFVGDQSPNDNIDADTELSVMSHEMSEAITDPEPDNPAWQDSAGNEIGDDCAYVYGDSLSLGGPPGAEYNQTINGDQYFIQEEFSNSNYFVPGDSSYSCAQNNQQSVVFDPNGGTGVMAPEFATSPTALATSSLSRAGYTFSGWNTSSAGNATSYADAQSFPFTTSATLYAQWTLDSVTFNANGGTGVMNPESSGVATALTANDFTRAGYTFGGWNTSPTGNGTPYANGQSYPFATSTTLYAVWSLLAPIAPLNVTIVAGHDRATLEWVATAPAGSIQGYRVFEGTTSQGEAATPVSGNTLVSATSYTATGLRGGATYFFDVVAVNAAGESPRSNEVEVNLIKDSTRTTLALSRTTVSHQRVAAVVFAVRVSAPGSPAITGRYRILVGDRVMCTASLNRQGVGTCHGSRSLLTKGHHRVTAEFLATATSAASSSPPRYLNVT